MLLPAHCHLPQILQILPRRSVIAGTTPKQSSFPITPRIENLGTNGSASIFGVAGKFQKLTNLGLGNRLA